MKIFIIFLLLVSGLLAQAGGAGQVAVFGPKSSGGGGSGTVTSVSVTTANGVSGSVATATTTPAISLTLGSITPSSVAIGSDPADSGVIRLENAALIGWEASAAGTDVTLTVNSAEQFVFSASILSPTLVTPDLGAATGTSLALTGSLTTGTGGSAAGFVGLGQGTAPSTGTTNIEIAAPASVTSYIRLLEGAANSSGFYFGTVSGTTVTDTKVGSTGSGVVMLTTSPEVLTSLTTSSTSFTAWAGATTLLTIGGTGASASMFAPSTLDTSSSTTGAIRTSGGISAAKALNIGTTGTFGGAITSGGVEVPTISSTNTLTNKRVTARVGSTASSATPTINTDNVDIYALTAQAADITNFSTNLTGNPVDGDQLEIRITGTAARAITWGTTGIHMVAGPAALPTTTITTKTLYVYFEFDSVVNNWVCMFSGSLP